jgi:DNA primase
VKKLGGELERSAGDDELLERVLAYYQESLKESPGALEYLAARGLSAEFVTHFRLGFSNRTLGYRLPDKHGGRRAARAARRLGVFRESGHEHFNGSLVMQIFDEAGRVTEMYGRKVRAKLRPGRGTEHRPEQHRTAAPRRSVMGLR